MKNRILLFAFLLIGMVTYSQSPNGFTYQAVIRDAGDAIVANAPIGMKISILQTSASGTVVYEETQTPTSNANGLVTLTVGTGTVVTGSIATIDWSAGPYYIKTETDPIGGTSYTISGTSQMMSVPFALYAANSAPGPQGPAGADGTDGLDGANGADGANGLDGVDGLKSLVVSTVEAAGLNCATGGIKVEVGLDDNADGILQAGEIDATSFVCNGTDGADGADGTNGVDGVDGAVGPAGPVGGADTQVIFNNAGAAAGSANLTWNNTTNRLTTANASVTALGGSGTRNVQVDNAGNLTAVAVPMTGVTGTGTNNYHVKWTTAGSILGNSLIQDDGTGLSVNGTIQASNQLYVGRTQITTNGDGQHTLMGYRTRDSRNDGTAYSQAASNTGATGHSFWGDSYSFGSGGWNYNDFNRCGGTIGAEISGTYWGSLGYKNSGNVTFGAYGSNAYGTGTGFLPNSEISGFGGGFFGVIGSASKGSVVGQLNSGELFATYNSGNVYTLGKNVELVETTNNTKTPVYAVTSIESTIYAKGSAQLVNGQAYIAFNDSYRALLGENPEVTVTPKGNCNGVYIASVDKNGFTIKEMNNGTSNVAISWISVGNRLDNRMDKATEMVANPNFDRNVQQVLFNDANLDGKGMGIWWDGSAIRFGNMPASLSVVKRPTDQK